METAASATMQPCHAQCSGEGRGCQRHWIGRQECKFFYNEFCEGDIPHTSWGKSATGENHDDSSQIGYGVGRRIFGIRFRRVGGVRRTGGANHASREVLHAV
jgi:hypothetical protein